MEKIDKKDSMSKYYKFGLYLIIIILINFVGQTLFFRADLTANRLYSLSDASKDVVATLKEPLTVNVFFTENLPAPYNNVERYLHDLLEEYELYSENMLSYRFYDVSAKEGDLSENAEENRNMAQSYGIYPTNVQKIERDEASIQRAYMGMVLLHGDVVEKITDINSTEGLEYRITNAIERMNHKVSAYLNLTENIKVRLVYSSSLSQIAPLLNLKGLENLKSTLETIVSKYKSKTFGKLEFVTTDPTLEPQAETEFPQYQRFALQWKEGKTPQGQNIEAGKAILALGMEYGKRSMERPLLNRNMKLTEKGFEEAYSIPNREELESFVRENIDNMIDINEDLGYLTSHDTRNLTPDLPPQMQMMQQQKGEMERLNALLKKEYTIRPVDLGKKEIPEGIDTLIIAGPKKNFSDWELLQIDQFLMQGKSLALFLDAFNEIQPQRQQYNFQQPVYLPLNTGLEKLLNHYGVKVKKSYVMDESCYVARDRRQGEMKYYFVPIIKNDYINHDFDFMQNIPELFTVKVSPVEIDEEVIKKNGLKAEPLLSSSDKSWEMKGKINLFPPMITPPTDEKERGSFSLAYLIEGEFPSYFADKPIPEKPLENEKAGAEGKDETKTAPEPIKKESTVETSKEILTKGRPGKIFIISTSEILTDNVIDEEGRGPNAIFLLNTLDYLNDQEEIAVMRSKKQIFNPIKDTKPFTRLVIKVINIAGITLAFIMFGIMVYFRRQKRKKELQKEFKK